MKTDAILIRSRLQKLRDAMERSGIDYYLIPTSDSHNSEYVADRYKTREFFSGFTGSNGTLIVGVDFAGLWTDGRYFIQAALELEGTGITLFRMGDAGVPTREAFLKQTMKPGECLGFDGTVVMADYADKLRKMLSAQTIRTDLDLADEVWDARPKLPCHPIRVLCEELVGESFFQKITRLRTWMKEKELEALFLAEPEEIMWLLNIRGMDVICNPIAFSYLYCTRNETYLFIQTGEIGAEAKQYFDECDIRCIPYEEVGSFLEKLPQNVRVGINPSGVNDRLCSVMAERTDRIFRGELPISLWKAIKNETELKHLEEVYRKDSAVLTRFIFWLKEQMKAQKGTSGAPVINEYTAAMHLDEMRSRIPEYLDLSFPTISAYGPNAAMMHYQATKENHAQVKPEGMLLVDSGGQYLGGTTDVTRTILLGEISDEAKKHFTAVALGMLRLADACFLKGCTGRNLDILAREALWKMHVDYKCGTGHGIGYILGVHEGPQNIRWRYLPNQQEAVLEPGMIVSDEPGVYLEDRYGIRTENVLEVEADLVNGDGEFLRFKHLTYVPIDLDGIDVSLMEDHDLVLLNEYHASVRETLLPYMETEQERSFLIEATEPIVR